MRVSVCVCVCERARARVCCFICLTVCLSDSLSLSLSVSLLSLSDCLFLSVCLSVCVATVIVKHHKPEATGAAKTTGNQSVCDRQFSIVDRQDPPRLAVGGPQGKPVTSEQP